MYRTDTKVFDGTKITLTASSCMSHLDLPEG